MIVPDDTAGLTLADIAEVYVEGPKSPQTRGTTSYEGPDYEQDLVPQGEHDHALTALAGFLRGNSRWRLSEAGIASVLEGALGSLDVDPRDPYRPRDLLRIARSIAAKPAGEPSFEIDVPAPTEWVGGETFPTRTLPRVVRWHLHGFVPRAALVTMYGPGGIGKTTWLAWLCAQATTRGENVGVVGSEDSPDRFYAQVGAMGGDCGRLFRPTHPHAIRLPDEVDILDEAVKAHSLALVVFDSLYDHLGHADGENAAERTRRGLSPLSELAQRSGCTIIGNFHTNKSGEYLGSTEVSNVSRVMLAVKRPRSGPLTIAVEKTNYATPEHRLAFEFGSQPFLDPDGEPYYEEQEDGETVVPAMIGVVKRVENKSAELDLSDLSDSDEEKTEGKVMTKKERLSKY